MPPKKVTINGVEITLDSAVVMRWSRSLMNSSEAWRKHQDWPPIPGYQMIGQSITPLTLYAKWGQDFGDFATPFEKANSRLVMKSYLGSKAGILDPVVDAEQLVVAHAGYIRGDKLVVAEGPNAARSIPEAIATGQQVFVHSLDVNPTMWRRLGTTDSSFRLVFRMDGQILRLLGERSNPGAIAEDITPVDLLVIANALVELGAGLGKRSIRALIRKQEAREGMVVLEGPTEAIAKRALAREAEKIAVKRSATYVRKSGITPGHFKAFQEAARETKAIAIVRNGKETAIPLIERGCPGKPKIFESFNTNPSTGILTATAEADRTLVYRNNYILVDEQRVARRMVPGGKLETVELHDPFWKLEPGQVIDPALKKPVVGDYDLMGVFSPANPGQNITLVTSGGYRLENMTSPFVEKFSASANGKFDMKRILHGAQDQYKGFRGGATAFFPDGTVLFMETEKDVEIFYNSVGRQPITGSYPRPGPNVPVSDELAARRGQK
jgi:hypothetical protein